MASSLTYLTLCLPHLEVPQLYYKKDTVVHEYIEKKIDDPTVLELFFDEMTFNVVHSMYPLQVQDAVYLAAIHLQLAYGEKAKKEDIL
jgi:hypothetical protein